MCMQLQFKKNVHGISPENKNHSQTHLGGEKKVLQTENLLSLHDWPDCFCAWEFWQQGDKKWASPPNILHMALQLDLYQNFVHTFNPASSYAD